MRKINTFEEYLIQMGHTKTTIRSYLYSIAIFKNDNPDAEHYNYKKVVDYLSLKIKNNNCTSTKIYLLSGIKKYFDYLIEIGKRNDHPCRNLHIRNLRKRGVIFQDLFSTEELKMLLDRKERYDRLKQRNQIIASLLVYQGLTSSEIANINITHIDFDNETIFVKGSSQISQRHLQLQNEQIQLFDEYILEGRKNLLKTETKAFVLGKLGSRITVDDIHYLVCTFKPLFPDKNLTPSLIRQSVIANWLNEKKYPLEQVQLMTGQKWISSTARYRHSPIEAQRKIMNEFHPLNFL